jgi:hypothetical protein
MEPQNHLPCKTCLVFPICKQKAIHDENICTKVSTSCKLLSSYIYWEGSNRVIPSRFLEAIIFYDMEEDYSEWINSMKRVGFPPTNMEHSK